MFALKEIERLDILCDRLQRLCDGWSSLENEVEKMQAEGAQNDE